MGYRGGGGHFLRSGSSAQSEIDQSGRLGYPPEYLASCIRVCERMQARQLPQLLKRGPVHASATDTALVVITDPMAVSDKKNRYVCGSLPSLADRFRCVRAGFHT